MLLRYRKRKAADDNDFEEDRPVRVRRELEEIPITSDVGEVTPDQVLSVSNCHVKLEHVDETVDEEDPLNVDHDTKPEVTPASPSSSQLSSSIPSRRVAVLSVETATDDAVIPIRVPSTARNGRASRVKTIDEWRADPTVLSVTEEGLPPGWAKIVKRSPCGSKKVFFASPTKGHIEWVFQWNLVGNWKLGHVARISERCEWTMKIADFPCPPYQVTVLNILNPVCLFSCVSFHFWVALTAC